MILVSLGDYMGVFECLTAGAADVQKRMHSNELCKRADEISHVYISIIHNSPKSLLYNSWRKYTMDFFKGKIHSAALMPLQFAQLIFCIVNYIISLACDIPDILHFAVWGSYEGDWLHNLCIRCVCIYITVHLFMYLFYIIAFLFNAYFDFF